MKRTIWTFGLISGAVVSVMMVATLPVQSRLEESGAGVVLGYTTMVLAFLLVYFGIRSYRDTVRGGRIGFGRAFVVGSLIALISSACYTATWEAIYFGGFVPNFAERYSAHELDRLKASGASQAAIDRRTAELQQFAVMYRNPAVNAAMTLVEPLPVGLVIALVSAGILSRGRKPETQEAFGAA